MQMRPKKSFLIDINGVLYTDNKPIPGASETIDFLRDSGYKFRFISNATQSCRKTLHKKLLRFGFKIDEEDIFSAPVATAKYVKEKRKKSCFLLTTGDVYKDFTREGITLTDKDPDYVVVGDAGIDFTYKNMNKAFNLLLEGAGLIAMEEDMYWLSHSGLALCAGPYVRALEYATGKKAVLIGKPSKHFLSLALKDMKATAEDTIAIGDDPVTDILGPKRLGMRTILVKTGKYRTGQIKTEPDAIMGSIADLRKNPDLLAV